MQSVRQKWLDVKSARIREQYESLGYTKEEVRALRVINASICRIL